MIQIEYCEITEIRYLFKEVNFQPRMKSVERKDTGSINVEFDGNT